MSEYQHKGNENLRPPRTTDEARTRGRNGGIKSGQARRQKKTVAEIVDRVLNEPITDGFILADITEHSIPVPKNPTYKDYLIGSVILKTIERGRVDDLIKIMELTGEKPLEGDSDMLMSAKLLLTQIDTVIN